MADGIKIGSARVAGLAGREGEGERSEIIRFPVRNGCGRKKERNERNKRKKETKKPRKERKRKKEKERKKDRAIVMIFICTTGTVFAAGGTMPHVALGSAWVCAAWVCVHVWVWVCGCARARVCAGVCGWVCDQPAPSHNLDGVVAGEVAGLVCRG